MSITREARAQDYDPPRSGPIDERTAYIREKVETVRAHYDETASHYAKWLIRRSYYYRQKAKIVRHLMPTPGRVLDVGCGTGHILAALDPEYGLGIDISPRMVEEARRLHPSGDYPNLDFRQLDALEAAQIGEPFDAIILSTSITEVPDVLALFRQLQALSTPDTRVVILAFNYLLAPFVEFIDRLGFGPSHPPQNWMTRADIANIAELAGFETVRHDFALMVPGYIPVVSHVVNRYGPLLPLVRNLSLLYYWVLRPKVDRGSIQDHSVTVCVPCRNEEGNIAGLVERIPQLGRETEIIFVNDKSTDRTEQLIAQFVEERSEKNIRLVQGPGVNKGAACRAGFAEAKNDILMILDADMTVMPEDLPDFVTAIVENHGEFINGSRLVYPLEENAMRFANIIGNKVFATTFSWLLGQRIKDTLCGTKVIWRRDYEKILEARKHFGEVDRWGDYDWIFGAARHNLKIVELPVHYRERRAGDTKMTKRFHNGVVMLKMCGIALRKVRLI